MTKFNASIAAISAALLLSGNAFAASLQPAAGEGPFFNDAPVVASTVSRAEVRADAARQLPASGELSAQAAPEAPSMLSRAQVRADTLDAINHGFYPAAGE